jgi:hypothetical protein
MFGRLMYAAITIVDTATSWRDREHPRPAIRPSAVAPPPSRKVRPSGESQRDVRLFRVPRHYMVNTATI